MPYLLAIATFLSGAAAFILRHPFVSKMMIFTIFSSLLVVAFNYIKALVIPYIVSNSLMSLASYLGVFDALSLYITIIIAGFGAKQILAFVRS